MKLYLTAAFSLILFTTQAQQLNLMPAQTTGQASIALPQPYVLVGNEETTRNALVLSPAHIESIHVYKGAEATTKYGDKAKDGAIIMAVKPDVRLVRIAQVYAAFKVPPQNQTLPVAINDKLVGNSGLLLANLKEIAKVEVKKQDVTAHARISFDEDALYFNIITK